MLIKIFGPGCAKCKETEQAVKDAVGSGLIKYKR